MNTPIEELKVVQSVLEHLVGTHAQQALGLVPDLLKEVQECIAKQYEGERWQMEEYLLDLCTDQQPVQLNLRPAEITAYLDDIEQAGWDGDAADSEARRIGKQLLADGRAVIVEEPTNG